MASKFLPVNLENIEEGGFLRDAENEFRKLQDAIIKHSRKYSSDESIKAELSLKVEVSSKDGMFSIRTSIAQKLPGRPKVATSALAEEAEDGKGFTLFAQSGTTKGVIAAG